MSTKVIVGLNIVFSIIVLVLWQKYSEAISRWETDHAVQEMALAQARMTATAQFKAIMATGTVEAAADKATATVEAKADKATATAVTKKISDLGTEQRSIEQKYQETLAQKLGAEAALRLNDEADPTLGTLLAAESVQRYQAVEGDVALRRGIELLSWKKIFEPHFQSQSRSNCVYNYYFDSQGEWLTILNYCRYYNDPEVTKWHVNTGQQVITFADPKFKSLAGISLANKGQWVVIDTGYSVTEVINVETGQTVFTKSTGSYWESGYLNPDNQKLALLQTDKQTVQVLDVTTQQNLYKVTNRLPIGRFRFSPTGQWLMTIDISNTLWLWDAQTGQAVKNLAGVGDYRFMTQDDKMLAVIKPHDGVQLWDTVTAQPLTHTAQGISIQSLQISPDGQWLATVKKFTDYIQIWATATGQEVARLTGLQYGRPTIITFSDNSELLVISDANEDMAYIWQTGTWQEVARLPANGYVYNAKFVADNKRIVIVDATIKYRDRLTVWEKQETVFTPSLSIRELDPYGYYKSLIYDSTDLEANKVAFSPDRKIFAAINDDRHIIEIKNEGNKMKLREINLHNHYLISKMAFSPDGQWLVTTSLVPNTEGPAFGGTQIWEVATGRLIFSNDEPNRDLAFSPNSQWLITNGGHVWEIATGREVARLGDLMGKETAFSPDSRYILSVENGTVNQWPWQPDDLVAVACQRLSRNLTEAEWRLYLGDEPYRKTCPNL